MTGWRESHVRASPLKAVLSSYYFSYEKAAMLASRSANRKSLSSLCATSWCVHIPISLGQISKKKAGCSGALRKGHSGVCTPSGRREAYLSGSCLLFKPCPSLFNRLRILRPSFLRKTERSSCFLTICVPTSVRFRSRPLRARRRGSRVPLCWCVKVPGICLREECGDTQTQNDSPEKACFVPRR